MLTEKQLSADEQMWAATTSGEWREHRYSAEVMSCEDAVICACDIKGELDRLTGGTAEDHANAAFIARSHDSMRIYIAEVRELNKQVLVLRKVFNEVCELASDLNHRYGQPVGAVADVGTYRAIDNLRRLVENLTKRTT